MAKKSKKNKEIEVSVETTVAADETTAIEGTEAANTAPTETEGADANAAAAAAEAQAQAEALAADFAEAAEVHAGESASEVEIPVSAESAADAPIEAPASVEAPANLNMITDRAEMKRAVEAMIFASPKAISARRIKAILTANNFDVSGLDEILGEIEADFANRGFQLRKVAASYQFRTNANQSDILEKLLEDRPVRLSASALEVLAIVAYKQPVTRAEVDAVRGIDSSHLTRGLMEKNLIRSEGHAETPGRPLLFATTPYFLEIFGLNSLDDLPSTEEFEKELSVPGDVERDDAAILSGDAAEMAANAAFHDRISGLPANPDRGVFDETAEEATNAPDFGVAERALSEA